MVNLAASSFLRISTRDRVPCWRKSMMAYVVAVCCSALQCGAVCCSALQCVAVRCSVLQCVAVRCSVLQCVAVCTVCLVGVTAAPIKILQSQFHSQVTQ